MNWEVLVTNHFIFCLGFILVLANYAIAHFIPTYLGAFMIAIGGVLIILAFLGSIITR